VIHHLQSLMKNEELFRIIKKMARKRTTPLEESTSFTNCLRAMVLSVGIGGSLVCCGQAITCIYQAIAVEMIDVTMITTRSRRKGKKRVYLISFDLPRLLL
jgi:hypothetical protein